MASTSQLNIISFILLLCLMSCKDEHKEYHNLIDKIKAKSVTQKRDSIYDRDTYNSDKLVEINENEQSFYVQNRKDIVKSFACSECHTKPVAQLKTEGLGKKAHWDISLQHADENTMSCLSCHIDDDMDNLQSITGNYIDLNYSYQLCHQCHNKEVKDWVGGAHGKNLSGWKSARVTKLCVECHNPHQPAIETRWPSRYNSKMVSERN